MKKRILSQIDIDVDMFVTTFEKASMLLLEQKEKLEEDGWTNIHFRMVYNNESSELVVFGMRLETDEEYNQRLISEQKKLISAEKKLKKERKKYEELKLKFDK